MLDALETTHGYVVKIIIKGTQLTTIVVKSLKWSTVGKEIASFCFWNYYE